MSHTTDTRWDANTSSLHHAVTTVYRPVGEQPPGMPDQAAAHQHGAAAELPLIAAEDAAAALEVDPNRVRDQLIAYGARPDHAMHEAHTSIRRATHKGHEIEIHTTYRITIGGKELGGHFGVDEDGSTHYHGLPNYQQASAVDLVKIVIDQFPDDFPDTEGEG